MMRAVKNGRSQEGHPQFHDFINGSMSSNGPGLPPGCASDGGDAAGYLRDTDARREWSGSVSANIPIRGSRMLRLGDPEAPFVFQRGDWVAWKKFDGSPDLDVIGEVLDGICEVHPESGICKVSYVVKRSDGSYFGADQLILVPFGPVR